MTDFLKDTRKGLTSEQAERSQIEHGSNRMTRKKSKSF